MKKWIGFLLIPTMALLLSACTALVPPITEDENQDTIGDNSDMFYDKNNVDYDLKLFAIGVPKDADDSLTCRVAIISDNHYKAFSGVGGYTDAERQEMMLEALFKDPRGLDCVIFAGDMVNQNDLLKKQANDPMNYPEGVSWVEEWKSTYFDQLKRRGLRAYCVNASHDSMLPEEFEEIFGYANNYVVLAGTTAYICVDTYSGSRSETFETTMADIPEEFATEVEKLLAHQYVQNAFLVCHAYSGDRTKAENFYRVLGHEKVLGVVYGHSHYNQNGTLAGKTTIQTGHFSRGYTKMVTKGLGFKPFVPLNNSVVGKTTDEDGKVNQYDYSETGSPWQYTVIEFSGDRDAYTIEAYQVFPQISYREFTSDGIVWEAFTQPYTEARPAFLGEDAAVDRSYSLVKEIVREKIGETP